MKILIAILLFLISTKIHAEALISSRTIECEGVTLIKVGNFIGAQTPFRAVFSIEGNIVEMIEGDTLRFSKSYAADDEITKPDRPGYHSNNGNLFFFKTSGRFEILKVNVTSSGLKTETTSGDCKPFAPSNVFQ